LEEVLARIVQFSIALIGAFTVALWFALVVWTYRDAMLRSRNPVMQVFSTLIVVLFFIPGTVIYLLLRPRETLEERQQRWIEDEYLAQELDEILACPSCSRAVRDEWIYCPSCRFQLRQACHGCGRLVATGWEACAFCGIDLPSTVPQPTAEESEAATVESHEVVVRPASWVSTIAESLGGKKSTADGNGALVEVESDTAHVNGSFDDETGELPDIELETPALESGPARRSRQSRRA
jgi:RNA polymerase subunit RPABC4/transcription elongation factor Spt4